MSSKEQSSVTCTLISDSNLSWVLDPYNQHPIWLCTVAVFKGLNLILQSLCPTPDVLFVDGAKVHLVAQAKNLGFILGTSLCISPHIHILKTYFPAICPLLWVFTAIHLHSFFFLYCCYHVPFFSSQLSTISIGKHCGLWGPLFYVL